MEEVQTRSPPPPSFLRAATLKHEARGLDRRVSHVKSPATVQGLAVGEAGRPIESVSRVDSMDALLDDVTDPSDWKHDFAVFRELDASLRCDLCFVSHERASLAAGRN